ncbi:VOC family protein [Antrihabitans sp. NCIMB 15449]|uniref:VOC family protein n=1 Tax=Antrihabitans spumae TaxID=3373370 RepID=A0ABW7JUH1_9NOCA
MAVTSGINHVVVTTPDLDRMVQFYEEAFDAENVFESARTDDDPRMAIIDVGGTGRYVKVVEIEHYALRDHYDESTRPIERLGLAVETLDQLRALRDRIGALGLAVSDIERLPTQWILSMPDPDGYLVQISAHVR